MLTRETLPDTLLTAAGAKATMKFALCPGGRVKGRVRPLVEKPLAGPETFASETVKLAVPELVNLIV